MDLETGVSQNPVKVSSFQLKFGFLLVLKGSHLDFL